MTISGKSGKAPASPQFISLSELSNRPLTWKELAPLVPSSIASFILNGLLIAALMWYSISRADEGSELLTRTVDEDTTLASEFRKDMIDFDIGAGSLEPISDAEAVPIDVPGIVLDFPEIATPDANKKGDTGSGGAKERGFQGIDDTVSGALQGAFSEDSLPGLKGTDGFGPVGDGTGLGGAGGGLMLPGGFGDRTGNLLEKARARGGNDASERAVLEGLRWFARHQADDGHWSLHEYHRHSRGCDCNESMGDSRVHRNNRAGTALALLAFLGAGQTHKKGTFRQEIKSGLLYLMNNQKPNGDLGPRMYAHGLCSIALCEAYALTKDPALRVAAQRALNFIAQAQHPQTNGWFYTARSASDSDLSVGGWQVMALHSGRLAGLKVSKNVLDRVHKMLDSHAYNEGAQYSYRANGRNRNTPAMTAAGLLCRQYMGWGLRTPELHKGCQIMMRNLPPESGENDDGLGPIYYYYYASQVLHHMGGNYWEKWNPRMRDFLLSQQEKTGHAAGSWSPIGSDWGRAGGRVYTTSLAVLTLEVYYRHLPLYKIPLQAMQSQE